MEPFTPDDFKYLMSVPPYQSDYSDLVVQYFGDDQREDVWDFVEGLRLLEENYAVLRTKKEEEKEQSINLLEFVNRKSQILKKCVEDLIVRLETEYERGEMEKYTVKRRRSEVEKDAILSKVLGHLHTLKLDARVMLDFLKCNIKADNCKKDEEEEEQNVI